MSVGFFILLSVKSTLKLSAHFWKFTKWPTQVLFELLILFMVLFSVIQYGQLEGTSNSKNKKHCFRYTLLSELNFDWEWCTSSSQWFFFNIMQFKFFCLGLKCDILISFSWNITKITGYFIFELCSWGNHNQVNLFSTDSQKLLCKVSLKCVFYLTVFMVFVTPWFLDGV